MVSSSNRAEENKTYFCIRLYCVKRYRPNLQDSLYA